MTEPKQTTQHSLSVSTEAWMRAVTMKGPAPRRTWRRRIRILSYDARKWIARHIFPEYF